MCFYKDFFNKLPETSIIQILLRVTSKSSLTVYNICESVFNTSTTNELELNIANQKKVIPIRSFYFSILIIEAAWYEMICLSNLIKSSKIVL